MTPEQTVIETQILYGGPVMRIAKDYYIAWE